MTRGRLVIVTGAAGGMGIEFVNRFLTNGDTVIGVDNAGDALDRLARQHADAEFLAVKSDISSETDCRNLLNVTRDRYGRVDVLIHAAGYFPITPFEEMSNDEWRHIINVNLTGAFLISKAVLPLMKTLGWGLIVFIGSASIFEGVPGQTHYVAAKAGVVGLARSLAMEVGRYGITVNVVAPGLTSTPPVLHNFPRDMISEQAELRAIAREEKPEDLIGPTFFLASPDADFISGQMLCVDGGKSKH